MNIAPPARGSSFPLGRLMLVVGALGLAARSSAAEYSLPALVQVLPVFFVPRDQPAPNADQRARFSRHIAWAQTRYREMLGNRATFAVSDFAATVVTGKRT